MRVTFNETTRGRGKVFVRFLIKGEAASDVIEVSSRTADGHPLPIFWLDVDGIEGHVLVADVLTVEQTVAVQVRDAQGQERIRETYRLAPQRARLQSMANTVTKNPVALAIRNCDVDAQAECVECNIAEIVLDAPRGQDILHGGVLVYSRSREAVESPVTIRVLDERGEDATLGPITILGDAVAEPTSEDPVSTRIINFSVRISHTQPVVTIWASVESPDLQDAFSNVEPQRLAELRNGWIGNMTSADVDPVYDEKWRKDHCPTKAQLDRQRFAHFKIEPTFSFVVPLYKTPIDFLRQMADSVLNQTYGKLELLLVNASPEDANLAAEVHRYCQQDARVREVPLKRNEGITLNTNAGIAAATGDFLCFMDHDDFIDPDLLFEYVRGINLYPTTDLLYCDEDKYMDGRYSSPFFKPDWSPDLLCSCNYVCHLLTVRKSIVDELETAGREFDGAQDQNMTLRVGEKARNVYHVRDVRYHWRIHAGSTAASADTKSYTSEAGVRAVQGHLDRTGVPATAVMDGEVPNTYHVVYHIDDEPLVSIVIPNKDHVDLLERCLVSICERTTYKNYEVIVVENNSTGPRTFDFYAGVPERFPRCRVVRQTSSDGTFNFSRTINFGAGQANGEYLLLLNNDTEVITPEWIDCLVGPCLRDDVGVVGCKLLYPDGTIQHAGVGYHKMGPVHLQMLCPGDTRAYYNFGNLTQDLTAVTGACLLTPKKLFDELGGLDETLPVDYNDIDYCCKMRPLGLHVVYTPDARLYHYESVSRGVRRSRESALKFTSDNGVMQARWPLYYEEGDPYLSRHFGPGGMYRGFGRGV